MTVGYQYQTGHNNNRANIIQTATRCMTQRNLGLKIRIRPFFRSYLWDATSIHPQILDLTYCNFNNVHVGKKKFLYI